MKNKVIVITGAFGILGRAVTARATAEGAQVVQIDAAPKPADATGELVFGSIDLTDLPNTTRTINAVRDKAGRVDALLNIAGGFAWETVADGSVATWERMFALNLKTTLTATKAALPHLIEAQGAIVNVGANGALKAAAGMGAYAASKQAVHKLTESLAEELKGQVRVNAVLPSTLDTPQNRKDMPQADPTKWVAPDDLAKVMLFLASDNALAVTGVLLPVTAKT